jgi:hypothetical protein
MAVAPVQRPLADDERVILEMLVAANDCRDQLRQQLDSVVVTGEYPAEDPTIVLRVQGHEPNESKPRVTIDGVAVDRVDSGEIQIILHVVGGAIDGLEFFRYDGEPVHGLPDPATVRSVTT